MRRGTLGKGYTHPLQQLDYNPLAWAGKTVQGSTCCRDIVGLQEPWQEDLGTETCIVENYDENRIILNIRWQSLDTDVYCTLHA